MEKANCLHLEVDNTVERYLGQPFKMKLDDFSYTPDCVIKYKYGLYEIREVKPHGKAQLKELLEKHEIIRQYCGNNGVIFKVVTENELSDEPVFYNRNFLYRSALMPFSSDEITLAYQAISKPTAVKYTLSSLRATLSSQSFNQLLADRLMFEGYLSFNTKLQITLDTALFIKGED